MICRVGRLAVLVFALLLVVYATAAAELASPIGSAEVAVEAPEAAKSPQPSEDTLDESGSLPLLLKAADGVHVYGDFYESKHRPPLGLILLFHQAGSNAAEYWPIAPRLAEEGFDAMAIDQRAGGRMWGVSNRTATALGRQADFNEAFADLEAAVAWAEAQGYRRVLAWGSSYSAASLFRLATAHPDLAALLAFSPGEFLGSEHSVVDTARQVSTPLFVTAGSGSEVIGARQIYEAASSKYKVFGEPVAGVHGSSTLREDRNPQGASANWGPVLEFLHKLLGPRPTEPQAPSAAAAE